MHDGIATAENRDSYANVEQRFLQSSPEPSFAVPAGLPVCGTPGLGLLPRFSDQAARLELFLSRVAVW